MPPNVRRAAGDEEEPVGVTLARMRQSRHLTGAKLASMVGMSQPKISRIERGKGAADPEDVATLARALGANDSVVQSLMERAEQLHDRMTDWRPTSGGLAGRQKIMLGWESDATVIRDFQPAVLPGLLQTSGYAKAALESFQRVAPLASDDLTETAILAAVSARVSRQEALAVPSKSFTFVITEAVLKNQLGSPVVMLGQVEHLHDTAAQRPNVRLKVIPDGAPTDLPPMHGFSLFDDKLVEIDVYNTGLISRSSRDSESYRRVFDSFESSAVEIGPTLDKYHAWYLGQARPQAAPGA